MTQAGYAEFAVLQVCSLLVCDDLEGLIESVSKLVGVVDFSYSVDASGASSRSSLLVSDDNATTTEEQRGKGKVD